MVRELVTVDQYEKIAKEHEYYLWNFTNPDANITIFSYFTDTPFHPLRQLLDTIDIPYFESKTSESYDFLYNIGFTVKDGIWRKGHFLPVALAFNKRRKVASTHDGYCYCIEGFIDMIYELNPKFILNAKTN
jgi:hypothetical protein